MSSSISEGGIGNILRLQGLKSVAGRNKKRVIPGAEFLQDMEGEAPDVQGTAKELPNFANFIPRENKPEADMGTELTSQSYDVRANTVEEPEEDDPRNWEYEAFSKFGEFCQRGLAEPGKGGANVKLICSQYQ